MTFDPVNQGQVALRRLGSMLRSVGLLPADAYVRHELTGTAREEAFAGGRRQLELFLGPLAQWYPDANLADLRALDYGCGFGRMSLPLAERCAHVYGVDISAGALEAARDNATRMGIENVQWLGVEGLPALAGRYDLLLSAWVFQHVPSRQGEQLFATLVRSLAPGGLGAVHFTIRRPVGHLRDLRWSSLYLSMNSYSLNRLGRVLADEGITEWHVHWHRRNVQRTGARPQATATLFFRKGADPAVAG